jgi:hypothetical protein
MTRLQRPVIAMQATPATFAGAMGAATPKLLQTDDAVVAFAPDRRRLEGVRQLPRGCWRRSALR